MRSRIPEKASPCLSLPVESCLDSILQPAEEQGDVRPIERVSQLGSSELMSDVAEELRVGGVEVKGLGHREAIPGSLEQMWVDVAIEDGPEQPDQVGAPDEMGLTSRFGMQGEDALRLLDVGAFEVGGELTGIEPAAEEVDEDLLLHDHRINVDSA